MKSHISTNFNELLTNVTTEYSKANNLIKVDEETTIFRICIFKILLILVDDELTTKNVIYLKFRMCGTYKSYK